MNNYFGQTMEGKRLKVHVFIFLAILAAYLWASLITFNQIEEDAFIYLRFAANIADGYGYVFNRGGEPIESGSSLLWQLSLVPLHLLANDPVIWLKFWGIGFACIALYLTDRLSRKVIANPWLAHFPTAFLALSYPFFCWAQRGLETPLYLCTVLLLANVCLATAYKRFWYIPALLVFCARPEGFVICLAILTLYLDAERAQFWRGFFYLVIGALMVTAFRAYYFHDVVPFPIHIKLDGGTHVGKYSLWHFIEYKALWVLAVPALGGLIFRNFWDTAGIVLAVFLSITLAWALIGEDVKCYNRHLTPALPFLFIFIARLYQQYVTKLPLLIWPVTVLMAVYLVYYAVAPLAVGGLRSAPNPLTHYYSLVSRSGISHFEYFMNVVDRVYETQDDPFKGGIRDRIDSNYQKRVGQYINTHYPKNIVIVYDQMGQTPWYAGNDKIFIDSFGLTTRSTGYYNFGIRDDGLLSVYKNVINAVAPYLWPDDNRQRSEKEILDWIYEQKPDLIIFNRFVSLHLPQSLPMLIEQDLRFTELYRSVNPPFQMVAFFERTDIQTK
jgi:hypothetical protein